MTEINSNSVSLAGDFGVLSQLTIRGYDANMTLGKLRESIFLFQTLRLGEC
jgi:hypothetical protein